MKEKDRSAVKEKFMVRIFCMFISYSETSHNFRWMLNAVVYQLNSFIGSAIATLPLIKHWTNCRPPVSTFYTPLTHTACASNCVVVV